MTRSVIPTPARLGRESGDPLKLKAPAGCKSPARKVVEVEDAPRGRSRGARRLDQYLVKYRIRPIKNKFMQKFYCYVDESGQDAGSTFFVVVAVVSEGDQEKLRTSLMQIEATAKTHGLKWHKSRSDRRINYLQMVLNQNIAQGDIFFGMYQKPLPYFFPLLEILQKTIKRKSKEHYRATVYVDGIDRKKAAELTNALRLQGIHLDFVKGRRDESEPIIRLADMWAGCIRATTLRNGNERILLKKAIEKGYLETITTKHPLSGG